MFPPSSHSVCSPCVVFSTEQCALQSCPLWAYLGGSHLSPAVGRRLFSWQTLHFSQRDWECGRETERTRTASEQARQTEKETVTNREIRWSGQTLGLEPRTEASRRDGDRIRLLGSISVRSPTLRRWEVIVHSSTWEVRAQTVWDLPTHLC